MPKLLPTGPQPPKQLGPPPTEPPEFDKTIEDWERRAKEHMEAARVGEEQLQQLAKDIERFGVRAPPRRPGEPELLIPISPLFQALPRWLQSITVFPAKLPEQARAEMRQRMDTLVVGVIRSDFYARLYSQVPLVIVGGDLTTVEEVLSLLEPPDDLTSEELDDISDVISGMVGTLTDIPQLPELAAEAEPVELPELVAPPTIIETPPTTVHSLTVAAIIRSVTAPKAPPSVMSREEWETFMIESGQISDKADLESVEFLREQAKSIVDEWQERNNMLAAFKSGVAEMPDYELVDLLKEMVVQPGMALLEVAGVYFENVSAPLAGAIWGGLIPDLDAAFQRYRQTESTWQALGHAWEEWDSPGEGAAEWILKYMIMEGLTDPLTYVGWGIATKIAKPLGPVGRWVGFVERGIADVLELPFDMIKAGLRRIPKTVSQQANIAAAKAGQYTKTYMSWRTGKAVYMMTMGEWREGVEASVKYTLKHPQVDNKITRAGHEFLKHVPVTEKEVLSWSERLGTTLTPDQITKQTIADVDRVFEDFFSKIGGGKKLMTNKEAADELVRILIGRFDNETSVIAGKLLLERGRGIINGALSFGHAKTVAKAGSGLMVRNRRLFMSAEESSVALALKEMGRVSTLLTTIPIRVQKAWVNGIDRWVIRTFAESYLTFALYGPMNVIEDIFRTLLGGVAPGTKSGQAFARRHAGVSYEPALVSEKSVSELMGYLRSARDPDWNNWILQLGGLADGFGRTAFEWMVGIPGQISMAMRRHFVDAKYTQIMKEIGGEALEQLARAGPDKLMGVSGKRLVRNIQQDAMALKMNGQVEGLRVVKADWTRAKIIRREVDEILMEHPDLPRPVRDFMMREYDDGLLFREVSVIPSGEKVFRGSFYREQPLDSGDFPGVFVSTSKEMAEEYGPLSTYYIKPGQKILDLDDPTVVGLVKEFLGLHPDALPNVDLPPPSGILGLTNIPADDLFLFPTTTWKNFLRKKGYTATSIGSDRFIFDAKDVIPERISPTDSIDLSIREANSTLIDDFIASPERASVQYEQLADLLTQMEVRNPQEMAQLIQSLNLMSSVYGATPKQILGRAVERTRGLPFNDRRASMDKALDSISLFRERAGASIDKVVERIKLRIREPSTAVPKLESELGKLNDAFNTLDRLEATGFREGYLSKAELNKMQDALEGIVGTTIDDIDSLIKAGLGGIENIRLYKLAIKRTMEEHRSAISGLRELVYSPQYASKAEALFNLQTAKRLRMSETGEQINAWRHDFFAEATSADLKTEEFWDGFSREVSGRHHVANVEMADFDGQIKNAIDDLDIAGGLRPRQRPAIKVVDRELSPTDVAQLIGARGDDISRSIMDVLTSQNDRDMFTSYVMAHVKEADRGFTKESVGAVYDQIALSLQVDPKNMSWVTGKQIELEAVRRDLHSLYNSKMLPDEEVAAIGKYFDDTADAVEKVMFEPSVKVSEFTLLRSGKPVGAGKAGTFYYLDRPGLEAGLREEGVSIVRSERTFSNVFEVTSKEYGDAGEIASLSVLKKWRPDDPIVKKAVAKGEIDLTYLDDLAAKEAGKRGYDAIKYGNRELQAVPKDIIIKPPIAKKVVKPEFADYDNLRQQAMDEAHKWYFKEFTDYSNANAFDSIMKAIYPFWTYESQRWFWLPRSFVRHPGTFTSFERWQDNTDYGYIHIPGTSVDINPFRGTIYGTLSTRLARRDYPEYYDSLGIAGNVIEFNDFLSRYGFYPGAHIGVPLAMFGGVEMQFGEVLPSIAKTPLDILIALFPDSESVRWISDHVFGDRFRKYMEILQINRRGGDGSLIFSKQQEGVALTEEEEQLLTDARREVGWYSAGFEQFSLFRMRTSEQNKMYEEASKVIEEMTGYTRDQQDWLRKHGYRLWDMVGGMSDGEQAILQEMDYYRWVGNIRPLLPGMQQEILNKIELAWNRVEIYNEQVQVSKIRLQNEFLSGQRGPDDYNSILLDTYKLQREFIDNEIKEYPLMDIHNRAEYYKKYKQPQPVLHPMNELAHLYFSIELEEITDPETGEKRMDWDNFWAQRQVIEEAVLDEFKQEWDDFLSKNSTRMEQIRRDVGKAYFRTYNKVWEKILSTYSDEEQALVNEYLFLERTGQKLDRQAEIKATKSEKTGNLLISSFRSEVSGAKKALRYANPQLDAWLFYWGRTSTFVAPGAEEVYQQISKETGRRI